MQDWLPILLGTVTVFAALILIIGLCYLLALACREKKEPEAPAPIAEASTPKFAAGGTAIPNRGELAAAIGAAIAEYSGTELSAIRILSIKKI